MLTTQLTMIRLAGKNEADAWTVLDRLYRPFVTAWFRNQIPTAADVEDLTQDVFAAVVRELPSFEHSGRRGAFRKWLKSMCMNRLLGYRRQQAVRGQPVGGSDFHSRLQDLPGDDEADARWDQDHDQYVLRFLFNRVAIEFESQTVEIFRRLTLDAVPVAEVAREFDVSAGSVYVARSRVLRKLREEAVALLGEELDATVASTSQSLMDTDH